MSRLSSPDVRFPRKHFATSSNQSKVTEIIPKASKSRDKFQQTPKNESFTTGSFAFFYGSRDGIESVRNVPTPLLAPRSAIVSYDEWHLHVGNEKSHFHCHCVWICLRSINWNYRRAVTLPRSSSASRATRNLLELIENNYRPEGCVTAAR